MEYEDELYAERLRRKAQAAELASGSAQWGDELGQAARVKLSAAWTDALLGVPEHFPEQYQAAIQRRTLRSLAKALSPSDMNSALSTNGQRLSLVEAQHEVLTAVADNAEASDRFRTRPDAEKKRVISAPTRFRNDVNRIFLAHLVGLHLHHNSRLVPIDSHEMHHAVVAPTLYLLHSDPKFASAETAYQKALKELRNRDPGDAITDAGSALQDVLLALGCSGNALGPLLKSAKTRGLLKASDAPLTESIAKTVDWVSATRGEGEAHTGDPDIGMSDAWMVVHVVGALAIRLTESDSQTPS